MEDTVWMEPDTLQGVKEILAQGDPEIRVVSGGTALSLIMKQGMFDPKKMISLKKVKNELSFIRHDEEQNIRIGSMTTLREIEIDPLMKAEQPVITEALAHVANPRIRYVASLGGNLAHGDAHLDLPPILMALGAKIKVESSKGDRWLELHDFFQGYYETAMESDEILTEVLIPKKIEGLRGTYFKYTTLSNDDWPTVGVAVFLKTVEGIVADVRIVISAATDKPTQLPEVEQCVRNKSLNEETIMEAAQKAYEVVKPLEDLRGSVWYKKEMVKVHIKRALEQLKTES
ncbi:FAD binding domain-containing protein [Halalkalibacter oceani]|uniref:FAD binding domain-containing protein n=1 Tax=Halalkalibacter oceani TaxID=1653776 RepID=UPI003394F4B8